MKDFTEKFREYEFKGIGFTCREQSITVLQDLDDIQSAIKHDKHIHSMSFLTYYIENLLKRGAVYIYYSKSKYGTNASVFTETVIEK